MSRTQVRVSPQAGAANWNKGFSAAGAKYTAGVKAVTTAPGELAAAASDKWLAKVTAAADKFKSRVASVSLQSWINAASTTGASRLATGATKGQPKMESFATQFYPYLSTGMQQVAAMPSLTLDDNVARSAAMQRYNAAFKRT